MKDFIKHFNGRFLIVAVAIIIVAGFGACSSNRSDSVSANSPATPVSATGAQAGDSKNSEQNALDAEKEKLEKERAKLEKEKQNLKNEKAKTEKLKNASSPTQDVSLIVSTVNPPSNVRDSPNGKILCTVKEQGTMVKLYGSTDITDNNGEWFYTKHCGGKMGVIHSTQFVVPG
jgi:glucan-binding YG repeat protein